jgi:hypothetical protein
LIRNSTITRHQWLTTVILAIWETEIKRIMDQGQVMQKVHEMKCQPTAGHAFPATWEAEIGVLWSRLVQAKKNRLYLKNNQCWRCRPSGRVPT